MFQKVSVDNKAVFTVVVVFGLLSVTLIGCCQDKVVKSALRPLSSHEGEVESILVTIPVTYSSGLNIRVLNEVDSILCSLQDKSWCFATYTQVSLCKPVTSQNEVKMMLAGADSSSLSIKVRLLVDLLNATSPIVPEVAFTDNIDQDFLNYVHSSQRGKTNFVNQPLKIYFDRLVNWYQLLEQVLNTNSIRQDTTSFKGLIYRPSCVSFNGTNESELKLRFGCIDDTEVTVTSVPNWAQDEYVPRCDGLKESLLSKRWLPTGYRHKSLDGLLGKCGLNIDSSLVLDLDGGNYLVSGEYIFIGKDVLKKRYSYYEGFDRSDSVEISQRLNSLNLSNTTTEATVTRKFEDLLNLKVVWVGANSAIDRVSQQPCSLSAAQCIYQPLVHVDMFMHPVSIREDTMTMMVGIPEPRYNLFPSDNRAYHDTVAAAQVSQSLKKRILESVNGINDRLQHDSIVLDTVLVPLPLIFEDNSGERIMGWFAFCNGLMSTTPDGNLSFYMPKYYSDQAYNQDKLDYFWSVSAASVGRFAKVHPIVGKYTEGSAIRCRTLVTSRSHLTE